MNRELEMVWIEAVWPGLRYYPRICIERRTKTSVRMICNPLKVRTGRLPNTIQQALSQLARFWYTVRCYIYSLKAQMDVATLG
jgi:hypothetical protein